MLGLIRFALAAAVLLSHVPGFHWALNPGVMAVICFYTISGYLMRRSIERFGRFSARPARTFLAARERCEACCRRRGLSSVEPGYCECGQLGLDALIK